MFEDPNIRDAGDWREVIHIRLRFSPNGSRSRYEFVVGSGYEG